MIEKDNLKFYMNQIVIRGREENNKKRYEGRITLKGHRYSVYGHTKAEVKEKAKIRILEILQSQDDTPTTNIRLDDYLLHWLETYKKNKIQASSYSRLCTTYYKQIKPTIGSKQLCDLTTKDIQNLIDDFANPEDPSKALAISGLKKIVNLLHPCLERAVEEGLIFRNPCVNIVYPTEDCVQKQTKEQFALTDDQLIRFADAALSKYNNGSLKSRDRLILLFMVNTGVRVGEMLALEWNDIDLEQGIVHVNKTLQSNIKEYSRDGHVLRNYKRIRKSTKTKKGVRTISLNNRCIECLKLLQQYDKEQKIISQYVACTRKGTMTTNRNLQRSLDRLIRDAGLPSMSLHTLRHTYGSVMLRRKVDISDVSALMGHANISITYNKYIHVIQEEQAKAMKRVTVC